jgi:DNA-binding PadR family transcriptional regulator
MSLEHAILALLAAAPRHGYEIGKTLNAALRGVRPVNAGQVYATLERLARDGAIARHDGAPHGAGVATGGAARRQRFVLLPAGRRALRRWLARPAGGIATSDDFALRLALRTFSGDRPGIARLVRARRARCATLHHLLRDAAQDALHVRAARRHLDAELAWLEDAERVLVAAASARPRNPE